MHRDISIGRFDFQDFRLSFFSDIIELSVRECSAVPGVFGPILTTGVALATAVVVVANPVNAPRADIQVPAVALSSGSGHAVDMLDEKFLQAIAPEPADSTSPFAVLKDLVSALLASAAHLGRTAVVNPVVGDSAAKPELTAVSLPYVGEFFGAPAIPAAAGATTAAAAPTIAPSGVSIEILATAPPNPAPAPMTPADTPLLNAVHDRAEADLQWAVDNANAAVAAASKGLRNPQSLIDQSLGQRVLEMPDLLPPLPDSLTAVVSLPHKGLPSIPRNPAGAPEQADTDLSGPGIVPAGDAAGSKSSPVHRVPRSGAGTAQPDATDSAPSESGAR
jgi:hypothetical protein